MPDAKLLLRETRDRIAPPTDVLDGLERRRRHKDNMKRAAAAAVAIIVAVVGLGGWFLLDRSQAPTPADPSEELGIFAPVAGRILYENENEGLWAVDPNGPSDTTEGQRVAADVAATLVPADFVEAVQGLEDVTVHGWSRDGTELLFQRFEEYSNENMFPEGYLYVLHADGTETRLNEDKMWFGGAAISPDGERVVFAADGLYVVDADGGQPVRIAQEGSSPTFSPDGTQVAYLVDGDNIAGNVEEVHVWVVDADGGNAHEILADEPTVFGGVSGLRWSPAGDRLALGVGGFEGAEALAIYTFASDGSDFTRVITGGESPYWSPDGTQIAYTILCGGSSDTTCPVGSILRSQFDAQPRRFGGGSAGLAIADADGSNIREFGFAASGPWHPGASTTYEPAPTPVETTATSGGMWPQSNLDEAREAQRLADAGDPRYTWQVFPESASDPRMLEFFSRFLQEELGWEEFNLSEFPGLYAGVAPDLPWEMLAVRCAPGRTNPLYPDDPEGRECAPTIDEHHYETVYVGAETPFRVADDPSAIWVVTRWRMLQPSDAQVTGTNYRDDNGDIFRRQVRQVVPPSDPEATALVEAFLQARVDGEGAEEYLSPAASQVPLLYATTSGGPYERSEFELVQGPVWPGGWREFTVRLFAAGGSTMVEQPFLVERDEDGRLVLVYGTLDPFEGSFGMGDVLTTENGKGLATPYEFLAGEVTFEAAPPWDWYVGGWGFTPTMTTLQFDDPDQSAGFDQLLAIVADPLPVEIGCRQGPAPADAEALARTIRSDPDLEATEPVAVSVGGIEALRMDLVAAAGASVCEEGPASQVVTPNDRDWYGVFLQPGARMRLYLLDLPEGLSNRILAIAISAPEPDFEHLIGAAEPIVDSIEFHAR